MRHLVITILIGIGIGGCGTATPMAELQAQALETGDWSLVEKRERQIARRSARSGRSCPKNATNLCERRMGQLVCECVDRGHVSAVFSGRPW